MQVSMSEFTGLGIHNDLHSVFGIAIQALFVLECTLPILHRFTFCHLPRRICFPASGASFHLHKEFLITAAVL